MMEWFFAITTVVFLVCFVVCADARKDVEKESASLIKRLNESETRNSRINDELKLANNEARIAKEMYKIACEEGDLEKQEIHDFFKKIRTACDLYFGKDQERGNAEEA